MLPFQRVSGGLAIKRIYSWRLWCVLLCGVTNVLLYERGRELFQGHVVPLLLCLVVLPMIGGFLTPEEPLFTAVVFASGSVPPLPHMPPISIVLWPFYWICDVLHGKISGTWVIYSFVVVSVITAGQLMVMSIPYGALVWVGWKAKLKFAKGHASL